MIDLTLAQYFVKGANNQNGLAYLQYDSYYKVYHPAWDLNKDYGNSDLGLPVTCPDDGVVEYVGNHSGFGNHLVIYHERQNRWSHYLHLQKHILKKGDKVVADQLISYVGNTGTKWAHCHIEIWTPALHKMQVERKDFLGRAIPYTIYPKNWPKWQVAQLYEDPALFVKRAIEYHNSRPAPYVNKVDVGLYRDRMSGKIYLVREGKFSHIADERTFKVLFGDFADVKWAEGSEPDKDLIAGKLKLT